MINNPFLHRKFYTRPEERSLYHRGRIKITSPDQFVPLFLANYGELQDTTSIRGVFSPNQKKAEVLYVSYKAANLLSTTFTKTSDINDKIKREVYKHVVMEDLKKSLSCPLPTEYSFIDSRGSGTGSWDGHYTRGLEYFVSMQQHLAIVSNDYNMLAALGVLCHISHLTRPSSRSNLYPTFNYTLPNHSIQPQVLTLIKYKYLAKARASLFLSIGMDIPHDGIKTLRTQTFVNSRIRSIYEGNIVPMCNEAGIEIEYGSMDVLNSYLFPPQVKVSKEDYIQNAIKNLTEPEPHVVF